MVPSYGRSFDCRRRYEDGMKGPLVSGSSIYQIGGQPGHRPEELVFVLKSIVALYRSRGKMLLAQCYDVSKFFDKEMIEDAVLVCYKRGVDPKAIRLWYKLNNKTQIKVKLPCGVSEAGEVGAVVGQGTIGGALVSQAVLDDGVMEHFEPGGVIQAEYGSVPLAPFMFQDDLINLAEGLPEARLANSKVDAVMKQRGLSLNNDKSVCVVIGSKKQKAEVTEEIVKNPLLCGSFETKEKEEEKWLGQIISSAGLSDCVERTVTARSGKIKAACLEIAQVVNDWRAEVVGGMETAILLWEACCISSLLHGAGTWTDMSGVTERKLNSLQQWYIRLVLQVGPGAPLASLLWDFGILDMGLHVWIEKLMILLHIRRLGEETLAGKVYQEQRTNKWPGLVKEADQICDELSVENVQSTKLSAKVYRAKLVQACHKMNEKRLKKQAEGKIKCERINDEKYGKKSYIENSKIHNVRQMFKTRYGLLPFAGNYSRDKRFSRTDWLCRCGRAKEEEQHLVSGNCEVYGEIRAAYPNLNNDEQLVKFFNEVLAMRDKLEEEDKTRATDDSSKC